MSSWKSTDLVRIIPSQSTDDPATEHARRLTGLSVALDKPHVFEKGHLVRWKAGLKNRAIPAYNEAAIIRELRYWLLLYTMGARQHDVPVVLTLANH